ncbi:MAG TPA: hypothetical protein VFP71_03460, partial [Candidatus Angelobacter sp.]|nr:hypothetical protein [Candidatus Angelobacter sp.]
VVLLFGVVIGCGGSTNQSIPPASRAIAFSSAAALDGSSGSISTENIWLANADGSGTTPLTRLTNGAFAVDNLVWSPDGSKLAFISSRALDGSDALNTNSTFNLWVMNADGSGAAPLTRLTNTSGQGVLDLAWSPDGRRIAFDSDRVLDGSDAASANGTSNVWVVNSDGTGAAIPLTHFTVANAELPVWSPDGSRIAFTSSGALDGSDAGFAVNIWVMNADGSSATPVTRLTAAFSSNPAFSPDGSKLAFLSSRELDGSDAFINASNLWVAKTDGSGAIPLTRYSTQGIGSVFGGIWSPDGKELAFESTAALDGSDALNANSTRNVWVANTDGSGAIPWTKLAYSSFSTFGAIPKGWSPDGSSLAFISDVALNNSSTPSFLNAWIMKADGSNSWPLTNVGGTSPAWKP